MCTIYHTSKRFWLIYKSDLDDNNKQLINSKFDKLKAGKPPVPDDDEFLHNTANNLITLI